ncbi:hypothetical protein DESUT3_08820 [Desulfuromonas versatilis]|uniref:PAS domain S-box protein n=1 Tax=Desulfuromonas versatilis TaxID=2802975 RepID=A0ABM9SDU3_9BACT|nr:PAS domain S-box protein [Desulfuromonas versatilis]BCR03813.1 hypothetical protein DESUT3_08820 [Desulfuromonas versatilis]
MDSVDPQKIAQRASEVSFRCLLENAAESVLVVDRLGRIVWTNQRTSELFGYRCEEMLGQRVEMLLPERHRQAHLEHRASYMAEPRNRPMGKGLELAARRSDGSEFPVEISLSHSRGEEGLQVMAIVTDITRLKQAETAREQFSKQQLAAKEEQIRTLERLSKGPEVSVTAQLLEVAPLARYAPTVFEELVRDYSRGMEMALEMRIYKKDPPLSEVLRELAERIAFLKGTPRDVVDIHRAALQHVSRQAQPPKIQGYVEEGHLLLVELMGYLASSYRHYAIGTLRPAKDAGRT